jgi:hypothetical protein
MGSFSEEFHKYFAATMANSQETGTVYRDLSENRLTLLSFCNAPAGTMLVGIHRCHLA